MKEIWLTDVSESWRMKVRARYSMGKRNYKWSNRGKAISREIRVRQDWGRKQTG